MPINPAELDRELRGAFLHDFHKMKIRPHGGDEEGPPLPCNADRDSARMSRAPGKPPKIDEQVAGRYRIDLIRRRSFYNPRSFNKITTTEMRNALARACNEEPILKVYEAWLKADLPAMYNEHKYMPYTSLKYHTQLAATLLYNYKLDYPFGTLCLALSIPPKIECATVLLQDDFSLHLVPLERLPEFRCGASLGRAPSPNFCSAWVRLDEHPKISPHLNSYLRQMESWSTALQLIEDWMVMNPCF